MFATQKLTAPRVLFKDMSVYSVRTACEQIFVRSANNIGPETCCTTDITIRACLHFTTATSDWMSFCDDIQNTNIVTTSTCGGRGKLIYQKRPVRTLRHMMVAVKSK